MLPILPSWEYPFSNLVKFKGGGSSGRVDYPEYMKNFHKELMNDEEADHFTVSMVDAFESAYGSSPWSGESAYDPTTPLADMWAAVCAYNTLVDSLDSSTDWLDAMDNARGEIDNNYYERDFVVTSYIQFMESIGVNVVNIADRIDEVVSGDDDIDASVDAYSRFLDDEVNNNDLPKFRAGMRDINAVNSSAFAIGEAFIIGMKGRNVAKYASDLRINLKKQKNEMLVSFTNSAINLAELNLKNLDERNKIIISIADQIIKSLLARVEFEKSVAALSIDAKSKHIIAFKEQNYEDLSIAESDAKWDLELFSYAGNLLASIGGATSGGGSKQPSKFESALGGAASGAAAGSSFGPWGAVIGGVIGAGASLLS